MDTNPARINNAHTSPSTISTPPPCPAAGSMPAALTPSRTSARTGMPCGGLEGVAGAGGATGSAACGVAALARGCGARQEADADEMQQSQDQPFTAAAAQQQLAPPYNHNSRPERQQQRGPHLRRKLLHNGLAGAARGARNQHLHASKPLICLGQLAADGSRAAGGLRERARRGRRGCEQGKGEGCVAAAAAERWRRWDQSGPACSRTPVSAWLV